MPQNILIVDDEFASSRLYSIILRENGFSDVFTCEDSRLAMDIIARESIDLVLTDLLMPHMDGRELLVKVQEQYPDIPVIILTAQDRVDTAVECMRIGAFDFMTKPIDPNRLLTAVQHAFTIRSLKEEVSILASEHRAWKLEKPEIFDPIITRSSSMQKVFAYMEAIAQSPKAVLITGESGTGKELIARAFHKLNRGSGKFVAVNVSGLDDAVFSDSLFGHRKGSFTGADEIRKGFIEQADDGTLFLDEIGDLQPQSQVKLLRLLQEGEYYPLGSDKPQNCNARIIAATNADLYQKQGDGSFRRDLYYRLIAHHIELPPLRKRPEDIPILADFFLQEALSSLGKSRIEISDELSEMLRPYAFPGNIRELQGLMYDLATSSSGQNLDIDLIVRYLRIHANPFASSDGEEGVRNQKNETDYRTRFLEGPAGVLIPRDRLPVMKDLENFLYGLALERARGNQSKAARMLDVSQSTLSRWKTTGGKNA